MEEDSLSFTAYKDNRKMVVSHHVLAYLLQPGANPDTVYGAPIDAKIVQIELHQDAITLTFDRPVPLEARFRWTQNLRRPKRFDRRPT